MSETTAAAVGAAAALALVAAALALALLLWRPLCRRPRPLRKAAGSDAEPRPLKAAWSEADVEKGDCRSGQKKEVPVDSVKLPSALRRELCETLGNVLQDEISSGLAGINGRLNRLERQVLAESKASSPLCSDTLRDTAVAREVMDDAPLKGSSNPRERSAPSEVQTTSLKETLQSVQKKVHLLDRNTQDLHRELRECNQAYWREALDARMAKKQLQDLLTNPACAPKAAAEELQQLREGVEEISRRLADAKNAETHASLAARRQRAFLAQNTRAEQDVARVFHKHPAGDVSLALPPLVLLDDDEQDFQRSPWSTTPPHVDPRASDPYAQCLYDGDAVTESDSAPSEDGSSSDTSPCASPPGGSPSGSPAGGQSSASLAARSAGGACTSDAVTDEDGNEFSSPEASTSAAVCPSPSPPVVQGAHPVAPANVPPPLSLPLPGAAKPGLCESLGDSPQTP